MDDAALRKKYQPGIPCWVDTTQPDVDAGIAFYEEVFGWAFEERPVPGDDRYLVASLDGRVVGGLGRSASDDPERARWSTYVAVADADAAIALARRHGGGVRVEPTPAGPAGTSAVLVDPTGAELGVWQPGRRVGAEVFNEPGSWVFSDLVTSDVPGATSFYEALFGWRARPVDFGGFTATMWCAEGYGDALAQIDPSLRERHADPDVPDGFSDAVGWLEEAADPGAASYWRVTFGSDDPDRAAVVTEKLGGRVLVEPHEAGPVRQATLVDPQGAAFVVSRYQP